MGKMTKGQVKWTAGVLVLSFIAVLPATGWTRHEPADKKQKEKVVYVCACLKVQSCSCMTEAKMEGPCACGTEGGPPMKAVSPDSDWAKNNREALAK